jgi:cob(I)alamin adenosyltransferase
MPRVTKQKLAKKKDRINYALDIDSGMKKLEENLKAKSGIYINIPKKEELKSKVEVIEGENLTDEGRVHIITGYGKYKTSAAFGTALRALNAGWKVFAIQFMKGQLSGEMEALNDKFLAFEGLNFGNNKIVLPENKSLTDKELCRKAWEYIQEKLCVTYKMLILDEVLNAVEMGFIYKKEFFDFLENKPKHLEVICTGRINALSFYQQLVLKSSLFSDIHCVKHYFERQCPNCKRSYPYHTNFCPQDGTELKESRMAKKGIEF